MSVSEFIILVIPPVVVSLASLSVFALTIRRHWLIGGVTFCAAFAETMLALSWGGVLPTSIPVWLDICISLVYWSGPFWLFLAGLLLVFEALAKPPRDMGVPPMKHGQDARATPARKGFCRIF